MLGSSAGYFFHDHMDLNSTKVENELKSITGNQTLSFSMKLLKSHIVNINWNYKDESQKDNVF